jgi:hypothetical protein
MLQKNKYMKLTNKQAINKLLNILRKNDLIFKSTNEKIVDHLENYERCGLTVTNANNDSARLSFQIEHPDYNNLDIVNDYSCSNNLIEKQIENALDEWDEKSMDIILTK